MGDRETVRVLLIDDQDLVRSGLRLILEAQPDMEVAEAHDASSGLAAAVELRPDVVLMDVRMPGMDGIEATRRMTAMDDAPVVVVLTTFDLDQHVYDAIRAGATGFLTKSVARADLVAAVRAAARGDGLLAPSTTRRLLTHFVAQPPPGPQLPSELAGLTERRLTCCAWSPPAVRTRTLRPRCSSARPR